MSEMMTFPDTWEEYEKSYGFTDNEEIYTNGARLIPSFRVKQWLDHLPSVQPELANNSKELENKNGELISRQKAKDAIDMALDHIDHVPSWVYDKLLNALNEVPSVNPTHPTPSNTFGALDCVEKKNGKVFPVEPISYLDCSNAMLKMWMDNVVTDGEYDRIMDKLNKKHEEDMRGENE